MREWNRDIPSHTHTLRLYVSPQTPLILVKSELFLREEKQVNVETPLPLLWYQGCLRNVSSTVAINYLHLGFVWPRMKPFICLYTNSGFKIQNCTFIKTDCTWAKTKIKTPLNISVYMHSLGFRAVRSE